MHSWCNQTGRFWPQRRDESERRSRPNLMAAHIASQLGEKKARVCALSRAFWWGSTCMSSRPPARSILSRTQLGSVQNTVWQVSERVSPLCSVLLLSMAKVSPCTPRRQREGRVENGYFRAFRRFTFLCFCTWHSWCDIELVLTALDDADMFRTLFIERDL